MRLIVRENFGARIRGDELIISPIYDPYTSEDKELQH